MFVARIIFRVPSGEASNTFRKLLHIHSFVRQPTFFSVSPPAFRTILVIRGAVEATIIATDHVGKDHPTKQTKRTGM